ncbi:MAG: GAF domain-containing SpoIIE family protein phosphatase [Candidatus Aquicultor sp.]
MEDLEILKTAALSISSGRDKEELFYTIVSSAVELIDCSAGGLALFDEKDQRITIPYIHNLPAYPAEFSYKLDSDILSHAIDLGEAQQTDNYQQEPHKIEGLVDTSIRAMAAVPLRARGKILGVLWLAMPGPNQSFSAYDMVLLESIGGQAAVAIDNITLFEEQRYISETLQRGFAPGRPPISEHTDIGIFYASATIAAVVGGDFYDAMQLSDGNVTIFVGDISGKGIEATADAAMVKYTLRAVSFENPDPASVLTSANNITAGQLTGGHFVTLVYSLYNTESGELLFGIAGHPYPLHYEAARGEIAPVTASDPAFALVENYQYTDVALRLAQDDLLVLYTDGIIELRRDKEFFGMERLGELMTKYSALKAQEIADRIIEDASEFARGRLTDDIVLMVIKRTG